MLREESEGLRVVERGGAMLKFWDEETIFCDFDSEMAVVQFFTMLNGKKNMVASVTGGKDWM